MENIQKQLNEIKELLVNQHLQKKEILTVEEATVYLQLSKSCLYKLTSRKEIPFYAPGGKKIYFKRMELDEWVFNSKVSSSSEFENEVNSYLSRINKI